jgi:hypothetical protein
MRLFLLVVFVMASAACGDRSTPPAQTEEPRIENTPPTTPQAGGDTTTEPSADQLTRRKVDWSILERDPISTRLGRWDEFVEAENVCLSGTDLPRCALMRRALKKVAAGSEIQDVIGHIRAALPILQGAWAEEFARAGRTFDKPSAFFYGIDDPTFGVFTQSEMLRRVGDCRKPFDNSLYCDVTNTIYFDAILLARIAAAVRETNGTTGRYAAIAIAGHELGHAWHVQVHGPEIRSEKAFAIEELFADCMGGAGNAALRRAEPNPGKSKAALIVPGGEPLIEGQLGLYLAGGPTSSDGVHAAGAVRADAFTGGFNRGFNSCVERFPPPD